MKRIFLILCLITISNISFADIASVGYVDSVVATKQDTISDIETIRTGAGLGTTAVQPSSLSAVATSGAYADLSGKPTLATVATSGSYNDLSNKPTIPNIPTGPIDGKKYNLVWNGETGQFMFKEMQLQCSAGTYDIGFEQCIDPAMNGTDYGYRNDSTGSQGVYSFKTDIYDLTTDQTWATEFSYGIIKGIASCNFTRGTYAQSTTTEFNQTDRGYYCWCKMTSPATSSWVFAYDISTADNCAHTCVLNCGLSVRASSDFRSGVFSSVGQ